MGHVFLSYARANASIAKRVAGQLVAAGFEVWWDEQLPAHRAFHDVIDERLHASQAVVVLWSKEAAKSDWVRAEADFARTHGILVQASIDEHLPPMPFNQIQCAKLKGWTGTSEGHPEWVKVIEGVRTVAGAAARHVDGEPARSAPQPSRWKFVGWTAAVLTALALAVGWYWQSRPSQTAASSGETDLTAKLPTTPRIAVLPFEPIGASPELAEFAAVLADTLAGSLSENMLQTLPVQRATDFAGSDRASKLKALGVNLALAGTVRLVDGRLNVRAYFEDLASEFTIWAARFERPADQQSLLLSEVAAAVTETAYTVAEALEQPDSQLDAQSLSLFLESSEAAKNFRPGQASRVVVMAEQVIARAPNFAAAHGHLALMLADTRPPVDEIPARLARAHREANRAITLHPSTGSAYDALFALARIEAPTDLLLAETQLLRGLSNAPAFAFLQMRRCAFLLDVGRVAESLQYCERAVALRPLAAPPAFRIVRALWSVGDIQRATEAYDRAARSHPDSLWVNVIRFEMLLDTGRIREAAAILSDASARPVHLSASVVPVIQTCLTALETQTAEDIEAAIMKLSSATAGGDLDLIPAILLAARLGRTSEALVWLARIDPGVFGDGNFIFDRAMRSVHRDPGFMGVAARSGHIAYWRKTGVWPDYCADPTLPYDCKLEAERALPGAVSG